MLLRHNPTRSYHALLHAVWAESEEDLLAIDWLPLSHKMTPVSVYATFASAFECTINILYIVSYRLSVIRSHCSIIT